MELYTTESFLVDLYEVTKMDFDIQDNMIRMEHVYNKTQDLDILTEGFNDIVQNIVDFFKRLLEKFKEFFKKIMMYINSHTMELDKFCKKYKDKLNSLDVKFTIQGYKFTIPQGDCPNLDPYHQIVSSYNSAISEVKTIKKEELDKERNDFLSDKSLNVLRSKILGYDKPIEEEDFTATVRKFFRDEQDELQDLEITKSTIGAIISGAESLSKAKSDALKLQVQVESLLTKTINFFDKKLPTTYKGDDKIIYGKTINTTDNKFSTDQLDSQKVSDGIEGNISKLLKLKYDQSKQIATMTTTIATERTKALNDNIVFFRKVLREALFKKPESKED